MKCIKFLFIILFLVLSCDSDQENNQNLHQFIPQNTQAIIKINEGSLFKETWINTPSFKFLSPKKEEIKILISSIRNTSEVSSFLCFSPTGKDKFSPTVI